MKEQSLEQTPDFYRSISFPTHIDRVGSGNLLGATALTVKNIYRGTLNLSGSFEEIHTIEHNTGKVYEPFIRARKEGVDAWQTLPSTHQLGGTLGSIVYCQLSGITEDTIELTFWNSAQMGLSGQCEIEIYFIDFTV